VSAINGIIIISWMSLAAALGPGVIVKTY